MATALEHYEKHLGSVYTWMGGDLQAAIERNRKELWDLGLGPVDHGVAVDLGAGPGTMRSGSRSEAIPPSRSIPVRRSWRNCGRGPEGCRFKSYKTTFFRSGNTAKKWSWGLGDAPLG
jgi:hypothetical protein